MTTNLSKEQLEGKLQAAVEEYNQIDRHLTQAREQVKEVEKGLEQARGKVVLLDELLKEQNDTNGQVEKAEEVVSGEVV